MISLPAVIGLPPSTYVSDNLMQNSLPVLQIEPGSPSMNYSMTGFSFSPSMPRYQTLLNGYGFSIPNAPRHVSVAFIPDNFPSDTFTNEYTENFLQKLGEAASENIGQLVQMSGKRDLSGLVKTLGTDMGRAGGVVGTLGNTIASAAQAGEDMNRKLTESGGAGNFAGRAVSVINKMMGGARIDMPQLWKNSSYAPSYSFTIRIYNPKPSNDAATQQYLVGPLAALLCLALPQAQDGGLYSWPFIHRITCPGLFILNPCYISSLNIIKGGDQQQISWTQRPGIVDVRMDITSLFNTMLVEQNAQKSKGSLSRIRPTLTSYLDSLMAKRTVLPIYGDPNATAAATEPTSVESNVTTTQVNNTVVPDFGTPATSRVENSVMEDYDNIDLLQPEISLPEVTML
jgi:hypothetical protein